MTVAMKINEELNGIELYFNAKPQQTVLSELKSNGFRWSNFKKCWYTKQSDKALKIANSLTINEEVTTTPVKTETVKKTRSEKKILNLWNATQFTEMEVSQITKDKDTKEIAKEIRTHIRKRFPQCKFSVTVPYYGKISLDIKSSPFERGSIYLEAIKKYCNELVEAYRICYDSGDSYSDIPASYNFHFFRASIHWEYTQTEVTEEIKKDMQEFDIKIAEFEKAEEERKEQEYQEYLKTQETRKAEFEKAQVVEGKQVEHIYNSIEVKELDENNQYFVTGAEFADLNKNNTIEQYMEEVEKGKYSLENVKITKEVHFDNLEALTNFSNMLLNDFDFLTNTGGSFTEDNRVNSMTDFYNMEQEEKQAVQWNLYGVAIYFNNELQFVVDAQGHSYARYVGLTDNAKIEKIVTFDQVISKEKINELQIKASQLEDISTSVISELDIFSTWRKENWKEYKAVIKDKLNKYDFKLTKEIIQQLDIEELKESMYRILQEVDGIQEQFSKANMQQGEKFTLFYISDWGSIMTNRITFDNVINSSYAQYDDAVKLTFTPEKKRKLHYKHLYSTLLVFKGWYSLPDTVLHHVEENPNGIRTTRSKYSSCDHRQYDEILNHFELHGIKPIINTYKPVF